MTLTILRNIAEIVIHEYKFPHRTRPEFVNHMLTMQEMEPYRIYQFADHQIKLERFEWELVWEIIDVMTERMP